MNNILKESNKKPYLLALLKEDNKGLSINAISKGEEITFYIFKYKNGKFYFTCPQKIIKPKDFSKNNGNNDNNVKDFESLNDEQKSKFTKLVSGHSYFVRLNEFKSSYKYENEPALIDGAKLSIKLNLNDNNKSIYENIPTEYQSVIDYKEMSPEDIIAITESVEIIKQCISSISLTDEDRKTADAYVITKGTNSSERNKILENDDINEFYYETDDDKRILIHKYNNSKNNFICYLDDENQFLCTFDSEGFLKVLIQ